MAIAIALMPQLPQKPIIGLVGGIGSGKSTIAGQFASLGCAVIDADRLARQALEEPGVKSQLAAWWGGEVLDEQGKVNRSAISRVVFDNAEQLHRLEALIHPLVHRRRTELRRQHQADPAVKAIVEDVPLLMEKGLERDCDVVVFVDASEAARRERVAANRGWTSEELSRRQKNQVSLDTKRKHAHYVVDNNADEACSLRQVRQLLTRILQQDSSTAAT